jgi:HrpA-like RNA helicase
LKALGIDNILGFDWPASPSPEAMIRALEVLYSLGILDEDAKLTVPLGFQVAEIPLVCSLLLYFCDLNYIYTWIFRTFYN